MLPINTPLVPTVSRFLDGDWNTHYEWLRRIMNTLQSMTTPLVKLQDPPDSFFPLLLESQ